MTVHADPANMAALSSVYQQTKDMGTSYPTAQESVAEGWVVWFQYGICTSNVTLDWNDRKEGVECSFKAR